MKIDFIKSIVILVFVVSVVGCLISGCRTRKAQTITYLTNGEIGSIQYVEEDGFHFFSDGQNKTLSPALSISGLNF